MEKPSLMDAAGWMALPIGIMWSASFLCTMYGTERPLLSMLSTALGIISIYMLYKQLTNYRRQYPSVSWLHILRLSFVTCLLAGLLTDAAQYAYFLLLDNGRLLTLLGTALQSEEYRQAWQQMMPEANLEEVQKMIQAMTVRDIMLQLAIYNAFLALPTSLLAARPVKKPSSSAPLREEGNEGVKNREL
ncbi:MAG: DUF4199 domain-containing protein [Bacteroidaceae bacterium]|nr:DUF4199 domain-containing protein [Bacteroidaceae bacterium]